MLGALQFTAAAGASWAVSAFNKGTAKPMAGVVAAAATLAWLAGFSGQRARSRAEGAGEGGAVASMREAGRTTA